MAYNIIRQNQFKKGYRKYQCNGRQDVIKKIDETVANLTTKTFTNAMRPHPLHGEYEGYYDCHANYDIVIIYKYDNEKQELILKDIGSHRKFGMHESSDDLDINQLKEFMQFI